MSNSSRTISRVLFPRLHPVRFGVDSTYADEARRLVSEGVGGFVLFDGMPEQAARVVDELRTEAGERPILFAADCEFGLRMRFDGGTEFPDMWCFGSADDPGLTYKAARVVAREMRSVGIDWNFAPVLDVNTNPANPVINLRSFGEGVDVVSRHGIAFLHGLQENGVVACGKHFPGHGDTAVDSHIGLPVLDFDADRLRAVELGPFRAGIEAGVLSIMTAHLAVPALDPSGDPASLSPLLVDGLLRSELGFDGVAVTDALDMAGVVDRFGTAEVARRAFIAGNDALETPDDPWEALRGLREGVERGEIGEERIERSVRRLDRLVEFRTRFESSAAREEGAAGDETDAAGVAAQVARAGMTTAGSDGNVRRLPGPVRCVVIRDERAGGSVGRLRTILRDRFDAEVIDIHIGGKNEAEEEEALRATIGSAGTVFLATMIRPRGGAGWIGLTERGDRIVARLDPNRTVHLNFGNPYLLREFPAVLRIDAYSASTPSLVEVGRRLSEMLTIDR